jgi:hypothetical protein
LFLAPAGRLPGAPGGIIIGFPSEVFHALVVAADAGTGLKVNC